jgi:pyruvate formate lyase activating enzyme
LEKTGTVRGVIFEIERFAVHDGPGIRTVIFFKGCNLRCAWCANPESQTLYPELGYKQELCIHCLRCIGACPIGNLSEYKGILSILDTSRCNECDLCVETCPQNALVMFGKYITVDDLIGIILKDKDFYRESNGGVTFSGGEPLLQIDFLETILKECRQYNIHTAIETAGCIDYKHFKRINKYVDLYLYDIKNIDPDGHKRYVYGPNDIIMRNLQKLNKDKKKNIVRVPLIPGFNDSKAYIEKLFDFCKDLVDLISVHFLPYHELGKPKYKWTGRAFTPLFSKYTKRSLERKLKEIQSISENYGISINIGGLE